MELAERIDSRTNMRRTVKRMACREFLRFNLSRACGLNGRGRV